MARESKKKEAAQAVEEKPKTLEQLILDKSTGKYALVSLASAWALELRRREENRHLSQQEILDLSLLDVLTGKISPEEIRKVAEAAALAAAAAAASNGKGEREKK